MTLRVLSVFGTRPEAIKMAPVVLGLAKHDAIESKVCVTAQHRQMLDQVLDLFEITPEYDLDLMTKGQDLFDITAKSLLGLRDTLRQECPDLILVHGDTTTCFTATLAAFYEGIPVGHVEAGLRTGDMKAPFPEEANRSLVGRLADFHFAPTEIARENLLKENISGSSIIVTGNTVIDALLMVREKVNYFTDDFWLERFGQSLYSSIINKKRKLVLITGHRRENFGQGFIDLCNAIRELAINHPEWDMVYPVHLNPNVQEPVYEILDGLDNVYLLEPQDYAPFVWLMDKCEVVLTDSGGIQEEAPALGVPVLVMRDVTERPEAIEAGVARLVGTSRKDIYEGIEEVLLNPVVYKKMSEAISPYGDGRAAEKIIEDITARIRASSV